MKKNRDSVCITVSETAFDLNAAVSSLVDAGATGATVSFIGYVRDFNSASVADVVQPNCNGTLLDPAVTQLVDALFIEHYPGMTEKALDRIAQQALEQWPLDGVFIHHRVGLIQVAEPIVLVVTASAHRADAFASTNFIMDLLKTEAPFWKKSISTQYEAWVEARESDADARERWL